MLLAWEQAQFDEAVADAFGYHALQLGAAEIDALRANRMPHRWVATRPEDAATAIPVPPAPGLAVQAMQGVALHCVPEALPFADDSLDLVVLPHTLESADDAHDTLAEVVRVLRPEGRLVIVGFNAWSLWGLRQKMGRLLRRLGLRHAPLFLPAAGEFISQRRARDWLRLLHVEVTVERQGCFRAALRSARGLERMAWMERLGRRWWPMFGAAYVLVGVKRVRGVRLVGLAHQRAARMAARPAVLTHRDCR